MSDVVLDLGVDVVERDGLPRLLVEAHLHPRDVDASVAEERAHRSDDSRAIQVAHHDDRAFEDRVELVLRRARPGAARRCDRGCRSPSCVPFSPVTVTRTADEYFVARLFDLGESDAALLRLVGSADRIDRLFEVMLEEARQCGARDRVTPSSPASPVQVTRSSRTSTGSS